MGEYVIEKELLQDAQSKKAPDFLLCGKRLYAENLSFRHLRSACPGFLLIFTIFLRLRGCFYWKLSRHIVFLAL